MLTIKQLTKNTEKGTSVSGFRQVLLKKYENYRMTTKIKLITAAHSLPYRNNITDPYFALHYKILSEDNPKEEIYYDVILLFITDNEIDEDTQIKIFCNSPQFMYTYAYCYNKNNDLIFKDLYPKIVLTDHPKIKNPHCLQGLDKHVYSCIRTAIKSKLNYNTINKLNLSKWKTDNIII